MAPVPKMDGNFVPLVKCPRFIFGLSALRYGGASLGRLIARGGGFGHD